MNGRRHYGPGSSWKRHDDRGHPSSDTASSRALRTLSKRLRIDQEETVHGRTDLCRRCADWSEAEVDRAVDRGGSDHRGFSQAHAPSPRRLPLCLAGDHPASDPVVLASLPFQRHDISRLPDVDGDEQHQEEVQVLSSAISTSTSPRCRPRRASSISMSPMIATSKFAFVQLVRKTGGTCSVVGLPRRSGSRPCRTRSTPC